MGIESDQVVYEYLSRVGDIAQQRQLSSATRMRLVSELRNEIDRRRAKAPVDSPAAVRRIIDRLGSPDDVVAAAADGGGGAPQAPTPSVPVQRDGEEPPPKGLRRRVPRPRPSEPAAPSPSSPGVPFPPQRAGAQELADGVEVPEWWRREPDAFGVGDEVPGFVGGVEIPEMLRPPKREEEREPGEGTEPAVEEAPAAEAEAAAGRRRLLPPLRPGGWSNPLLLLAAGALVAGAVLGNLLVLVVGWGIAYASRRLTETETKLAVMWLPGGAVAAGLVWLWGRSEGRWGAPIAEGHMNDALAETWPWVVRGAAVASALFLLWRSQRRQGQK
ncbi:hypothetical protein ACIBVL_23755 [Streptomyces sp. NPDC049687]|uniref:hypothetical protein n=1 Tax=Streptomyces sp. NPDC049687 TaxID=3365596 RepID=UPI0037B2C79C